MKTELREQYVNLVNALGLILGPSYEIALHDLSMGDKTIIAIANGQISKRSLGSPLTPLMLNLISSERYKTTDYEVNYISLSMENKVLRSSTVYIKDKEELVGLLCITFDDSKYRQLSSEILSLCHPDELIGEHSFERIEDLSAHEETEVMNRNVDELVDEAVDSIIAAKFFNGERLKKAHKLTIVHELKKRGIFMIKGAVIGVAKKLSSSEATIYRYLKEIELGADEL
ncbi:MAG: PAS domain-containing protein [Tissierellia bacterium]|nr:PAS domain-containing protein [Tissierellia bacterium]